MVASGRCNWGSGGRNVRLSGRGGFEDRLGSNGSRSNGNRGGESIEVRSSVARGGSGRRGIRSRGGSSSESIQIAEGKGRGQDGGQNSAGKDDLHFDTIA